MFKKFLVIATLAAGLISTQANAAFISTDWKTTGDALATLDTETGLEWLDLTYTVGKSLNDIEQTMQLDLAGWRLATQNEVIALWAKAMGRELSDTRFNLRNIGDPLGALLGSVVEAGLLYTVGITYSNSGSLTDFGTSSYGGGSYYNLWNSGYNINSRSTTRGFYLVSDGGVTLSSISDPTINANNPNAPINMADVSAPTGLAGAGLLMLMLGARRKAA